MRPPFALRATAATTALALTLAACSGSADEGEDTTTSSSSPSSSAKSSSSTTTAKRQVTISGASASLTSAVATKYGSRSVEGAAQTGTWRGAKVAVVTAEDDVTLAVRPKNRERWKVVGGWWPSLGEKKGKADLGGGRHVLVVGSDAREGEEVERSRADAIQLLGVDGHGGAGLMGFARDLWVPIPGRGHGKLNSSMVSSGASGQAESVSSISGIDVDGYVVTGFEGFGEIVDELGGLNFTAPKKMASHLTGGQIKKGYNHLDGQEALAWSRERKTLPGGDFDRSRNQGLLLAAAAVQARLRGPDSLPEALSVIDKNASSNLSAEDMLLFTAAFYRVKPTQVGHEVAKGPTGMQSGQSIVRLDSDSKAAFRDFRDGRLS